MQLKNCCFLRGGGRGGGGAVLLPIDLVHIGFGDVNLPASNCRLPNWSWPGGEAALSPTLPMSVNHQGADVDHNERCPYYPHSWKSPVLKKELSMF